MTPTAFCLQRHVLNDAFHNNAVIQTSRCQLLESGISSETSNESENIIQSRADNSIIDLFPRVTDFRNRFQTKFIFVHLNINSYRHKFGYISDILNRKCVDYMAISETKLDDSFPKSQFIIEGYSLYRQDLTSSSGGLIVYVRDDLPHRRMTRVEINRDCFESLCLELTIGKSKTIFTCIYKHPKVTNELFVKYFFQSVWYLTEIPWGSCLPGRHELLPHKIEYYTKHLWVIWPH